MGQLLMPMATAVWLVENTALSFQQIAKFCDLHLLEVHGIADETIGTKIAGLNPVHAGQLTHEEIKRCEDDPKANLVLRKSVKVSNKTKGPRYTPLSKRENKPDGIAWLLRHHPELSDAQITKLIGTTKNTISSLRDRTHWNMQNIKSQDPVGLGLCSQNDLNTAISKAQKAQERKRIKEAKMAEKNLQDEQTVQEQGPQEQSPKEEELSVQKDGPSPVVLEQS